MKTDEERKELIQKLNDNQFTFEEIPTIKEYEKTWFGYKIMVEITKTDTCCYSFDQSPEYTRYYKATQQDLVELNLTSVNQSLIK